MRATHIYRLLILGVLPLASAVSAMAAFFLGTQSSIVFEKLCFYFASFFSATIFIWIAAGILVTCLANLYNLSSQTLENLWIFRPIFIGLLGTATIAQPAQASDIIAVQPLEQHSPFFPEQETDTGRSSSRLFFSDVSDAVFQETIPVDVLEVASENTQSSQDPSIFFRNPESQRSENTELIQETHTVIRGDTLWTIAENSLPENSTPAQIMQRTYQIFELNSDQLESLDSLIYAGQILRLPETQNF